MVMYSVTDMTSDDSESKQKQLKEYFSHSRSPPRTTTTDAPQMYNSDTITIDWRMCIILQSRRRRRRANQYRV